MSKRKCRCCEVKLGISLCFKLASVCVLSCMRYMYVYTHIFLMHRSVSRICRFLKTVVAIPCSTNVGGSTGPVEDISICNDMYTYIYIYYIHIMLSLAFDGYCRCLFLLTSCYNIIFGFQVSAAKTPQPFAEPNSPIRNAMSTKNKFKQ